MEQMSVKSGRNGMEFVRTMRHLFIINPAAGKRRTTQELEVMLDKLSFPHEVVYTKQAGDARRFTEAAVRTGEPVRIYACGGDGTLNEVVNGAAGYSHVAITNVPKGTGNDFLKIFGPNCRSLFYNLEELAIGPETPFDLIDCNGHLGIDVVCAGVDARVAADVHRYKDWWLVSGIGAYILALAENVLFKGIARPISVQMGDIQWENQPACLLCVCNGRYYGGGVMPVGDAMPDDGILDVLLVKKVGRFTFLRLVDKYAKGLYRQYPELILSHHGQEVTFSAQEEITAVVDGEVMRDTAFTVCLSEKKVNFFYPAGAGYQPSRAVKIS